MKTKKLNGLFGIIIGFALIAGVSSCTSKGEAGITADAFVRIANSSEGSAPQDFYLDNTKVNGSAVAYTQSSSYITTQTGNRTAEFKSTGTSTTTASSSLSLEPGKYYTVYYTGGASSQAEYATEDDMTAPSSGKAKVRFVNLSTVASSSVDLAIQGGAKIVNNLAAKAASAYQQVDAATSFQLYASGSSTAMLNLTNLSIQAGKIYTVFISGSTTATITYHIMVDKQ